MTRSALVIGGTGPTGPPIVAGLAARGFEVTVLHSGRHELAEVAHFRHLHGDVFSEEGLRAVLGDARVRRGGRQLRPAAQHRRGAGGPGRPLPVHRRCAGLPRILRREGAHPARAAGPDPGGRGAGRRDRRRQELPHRAHRAAGLRQPSDRPRTFATRTSTGRVSWPPASGASSGGSSTGGRFSSFPTAGLSLITFGYVDNLAHALLLAVDQPSRVDGRDLQLRRRRAADDPAGRRDHRRRARPRLGADLDAVGAGRSGPAAA